MTAVAARRPFALVAAQLLWLLAVLPFLGLAAVTDLGTREHRQRMAAELPRLVAGALENRWVGVLLWLAGITFVLAAVSVGPGRAWARTAAATCTGLYDAALVMLLLGDVPRPAGWSVGAAVVVMTLAAVVLSYQPPVERYLAGAPGPG